MNKKLKKLAKKINKFYWKNNQRLYLTTHCYFNKRNDFHADIYATTEKGDPYTKESIYLFDISTLSDFQDSFLRPHFWNLNNAKIVITSTIVESAPTPLYMNRQFTLKKFGCITEEDIKGCAKYFMYKVLGKWLPCNYKVIIEYEEDIPKEKE